VLVKKEMIKFKKIEMKTKASSRQVEIDPKINLKQYNTNNLG